MGVNSGSATRLLTLPGALLFWASCSFGHPIVGMFLNDKAAADPCYACLLLLGGGSSAPATLDTTFGTNGIAVTKDIGGAGKDEHHAVALDSSDRILAGGLVNEGGLEDGILWRFTTDGQPDTTFNATGYRIFDTVGILDTRAISAITTSGTNIVFVGSGWNGANGDAFIVRLDSSGGYDTGFNGTGYNIDGYDAGRGVAVYGGTHYYTGNGWGTAYDIHTRRYNSGGAFQNRITHNGTASSNDSANNLVIDSSGNIYVVGYSSSTGAGADLYVAKYDSTLGFVTSVTLDGLAGGTAVTEEARDITLDGNGQLIVVGYARNSSGDDDAVVLRLNTDLSYDTTFNGTGRLILKDIGASGATDILYSVKVDTLGRIIVGGKTSNGSDDDMLVCRILADGTVDTTLAATSSGCWTAHNLAGGAGADVVYSILIDSANRIIIAGYSSNGADHDGILGRLIQ